MEKLTINQINEVYIQIDCSHEIAMELYSFFECYVPNYLYMPQYRAKCWNGKSSFFNNNTHELPIGLLNYLYKFCDKFKYELQYKFDKSTLYNEISDEWFETFFDKHISKDSKFDRRDYQLDAVKSILRSKRGLLNLATGSGKSFIIYLIIRYLIDHTEGKIMLIVPNIMLIHQMADDFRDYGFNNFEDYCSEIFYNSSSKDLNKRIYLGTWQSIQKFPQKILNQCQSFILDEAHTGGNVDSKIIKQILSKCINCEFRIGASGTVWAKNALPIIRLTLEGYVGEIVAEKKSHELIAEGTLTPINVINVLLKYNKSFICKSGRAYADEISLIENYPDRNKILKHIISKIKPQENIIILVKNIEHLHRTSEFVKEIFKDRKVFEIYGKIDGEIRNDIRKFTENNDGVILCGTYKTLSQGVNIKNLFHIILFSSYKEPKTLIQVAGRLLRQYKGKNKVFMWDITDDMSWIKKTGKIGMNYVYSHWLERLEIYKDQQFPFKTIRVNLDELQ